MPVAARRFIPLVLVAALALCAAGCSRGDGGLGGTFLGFDLDKDVVQFWARGLSAADNGSFYRVSAILAAEGTRCRVYRELGPEIPDNVARAIAFAFDNVIYPSLTAAYGSEPRPVAAGGTGDVDGDVKIAILLMDIRDDFAATGDFIGGLFDPVNEFRQAALDAVDGQARSNEREMIYLDVKPMAAGGAVALRELARQFQHMIHFNASARNRRGPGNAVRFDDAWLDEAMSETAPAYCRYEPEFERLQNFELYPWDSLTEWAGRLLDFSPVFMWGMYFKDRFDNNVGVDNGIFRLMLQSDNTGIASVNDALARRGAGTDFPAVFRDWSIAAAAGNRPLFPGHPEWSYASLSTTTGQFGGLTLPGLFNSGNSDNTTMRVLGPWSVDYFSYTQFSGSDNSLVWTPVDNAAATMFAFNGLTYTLPSDILPGVSYPYVRTAFLIVRNPTDNAGAGGGTVSFAPAGPPPGTPREMLRESARPAAPRPAAAASAHAPLCAEPFLVEETRKLLVKGAVLPF